MMISDDFSKTYFKVCESGYNTLGHTNPYPQDPKLNEWHFKGGHPPSYSAQARFRLLKTLQTAEELNPKKIFEVATGNGFNGACLYKPGRTIILNDLRPIQNSLAQWKNGEQLQFVQKNIFELDPNQVGLCDLVMACEVIEHVADGPNFLSHLSDFIIPGGHLLLTTPNGKYFRSKLPTFSQVKNFKELENRQFGPDAEDHLFLYTTGEIKNLLSQVGFEKIEVQLFITPWISGHMGFRYLPKTKVLTKVYYFLDYLLRSLGRRMRERFCTQIIVTAQRIKLVS